MDARSTDRQDQAGEPSTGTEVHQREFTDPIRTLPGLQVVDPGQESCGVVDVSGGRPRTQEAQLPRAHQDPIQGGVGRGTLLGTGLRHRPRTRDGHPIGVPVVGFGRWTWVRLRS